MDSYIVRQAISTDESETVAYEILYSDRLYGNERTDDSSAANAIENFLSSMDNDSFLNGKLAFLTFTHNLLEKNIPKIFSTSKLVIQIEDYLITNPSSQTLITKYKNSGYKTAVVDFEFNPRYFGILSIVDYIKLDFSKDNPSLENIVKIGNSFGKKIIAYNISNREQYYRAKVCGCDLFQGSFVSEKMPTSFKAVNHIQSNFFMLMVAVTKDEPNVDEIEEIISRDVSLTYAILKMVNSAYFALKNRARSVKQALVILGLGQLKQWIYLLSFRQDDGSMPDELIRISFLRAKFASELNEYAEDMPISRSEAYLMGMFSTLSKLMQTPLEMIIDELPIGQEIKDALLYQTGRAGTLYRLIIAYENADWRTMSESAIELSIPQSAIAQVYFECVENVNMIWTALTHSQHEDEENE